MVEKGKFETTEKRIRTAFSSRFVAVGVVVSVLALLAAAASVVIMLRSERIEVTAQVVSCGELTKYSPIAELEGHFTYVGEEVAHLWKLTVKFVNSGDRTIVGQGNQKNIIGDGVNFVFRDETRILKIEDESTSFQSTIVKPNLNSFQIQFQQWRSGEYSVVSFYVASDEPLDVDPLPTAPTRDIIDGNIIVEDLTERRPLERVSLIDRLPRGISTPGKIIGGIYAGAVVLSCIIILAWAWMDTIKRLMWERRYLSNFSDYLDQIEPYISKSLKGRYRKAPEKSPNYLWANFEGKKASWSIDFPDKSIAIIITVFIIFTLFGFASLILMLFPA